MKLLLLKTLLQRRARDEGFTLPMVIALGLVMLLLGTVNIVKSSEENTAAINQNSSSDALAIAEVGVARYREFLNQNRILTIYNHEQWTSNNLAVDYLGNGVTRNINVSGQTCNNLANTPAGWFDDNDAGTNVSPSNTNQWWEIKQNLADDSIGEYRLVSYRYDIDDNLATNNNGQFAPDDDEQNDNDLFDFNDTPGTLNNPSPPGLPYNTRGILTIQGRSSDGSEAQIEVEIPLRINDLEDFAPVLWIGNGAITTPGTIDITNSDDNIVLSDSGGECIKPADINSNNVISDARNIPSIQTVADTINAATVSQLNGYAGGQFGKTNENAYVTGVAGDDCETASDYCYFYDLTQLDIDSNAQVDGVSDVTVYVDGSVSITPPPATPATVINIGGTTFSSSDYFELYVDNGNLITITPNGNTVNIRGLIHAPTSTLTIVGNGTVNINGAVWVNDIINTSATLNITGDDSSIAVGSGEPAYKFYTTSETRTPRPVTSSPTNWVREEVE